MTGELVPVGGGDAIPLIRESMTVGRRRSNDICLEFANVSGQHCEFYSDDGIWFVRDTGSQNGTKVNGDRISGKKALKPGDTVQIAKQHTYTIDYVLSDDAKMKMDELAGQEDDVFGQSLMEKAGLQKSPRGGR